MRLRIPKTAKVADLAYTTQNVRALVVGRCVVTNNDSILFVHAHDVQLTFWSMLNSGEFYRLGKIT